MTGSHIDTVAHRRPLRRQPRRARRARGRRDARAARHRHRAPDRRRLLHRRGGRPLRARHARQPRVRRRHGARGGARRRGPSTTAPGSATSWPASATPARCRARRRAPPHAYVELHIEQGPILEDEGVDDRRRRGRAGHLVDRADDQRARRPTPARRRCGCAATPATSPPRSPRSPAGWRVELGGAQVGTVGRFEVRPDLVNVVANAGDADRRPAQHRRRRAAARPKRRWPPRSTRLAAAEGVTVDDAVAGPLRAGRVRPGDGRPRRGDGRSGSATRRGGCRAAPATTPRCWPGSARRR